VDLRSLPVREFAFRLRKTQRNRDFSDGVTQAQGVNVIARSTNLPSAILYQLYPDTVTGNTGQTVLLEIPLRQHRKHVRTWGSLGSHDPGADRAFRNPVASWARTRCKSSRSFRDSSELERRITGPADSRTGNLFLGSQCQYHGWGTTLFNITLQGTLPRFDAFESASLLNPDVQARWLRPEQLILERQNT